MMNDSKTSGFRHLASEVMSHSGDWARTGQDLARTGSRRARTFINKQPMAATLIGLGVGYLLGKLFTKGKSALALPAFAKGTKRRW